MDVVYFVEVELPDNSCGDPDCCGGPYFFTEEMFIRLPFGTQVHDYLFDELDLDSLSRIQTVREATPMERLAFDAGYDKRYTDDLLTRSEGPWND